MIFKIFDYAEPDQTGGELGYIAKCTALEWSSEYVLTFPVGMYGAQFLPYEDVYYPMELIHVPFKAIEKTSDEETTPNVMILYADGREIGIQYSLSFIRKRFAEGEINVFKLEDERRGLLEPEGE